MPASSVLAPLTLALLLTAGATPARAQVQPQAATAAREMVAKEIDVSRRVAALRLGFADQGELELELSEGSVQLDGDEIGRYREGDALEAAWRALLGDAVTLEDGPLAQLLRDWAPPAGLSGDEAAAAARIDGALEAALSGAVAPGFSPGFAQTLAAGSDRALLELLDRPDELLLLARAIQGLDLDDVQVHVGEDALVAEGQTVEGSIVVVDGDLDVDGEVDGDAVVVGGALRLAESGRVTGDVRLADARIFRDGEVLGSVTNLGDDPDEVGSLSDAQRERLRDELREELREDEFDQGPRFGPLGRVGEAIGHLIGLGVVILLVGVVGGGLALHFAREELDVVAETARRNPVQAGLVGLAGAFLVIPVWVLGTIALIITIVGILAVPFWVVLFPLAVAVSLALGYLAVAQGLGEWVARQRYSQLGWVTLANPYSTIIAGVGALMLAFLAAHVLSALALLGWVSVLLTVLGVLATVGAALIGFGAVLLTRGGTRPDYRSSRFWSESWDDLGFATSAGPASGHPPEPPPTGPGEI